MTKEISKEKKAEYNRKYNEKKRKLLEQAKELVQEKPTTYDTINEIEIHDEPQEEQEVFFLNKPKPILKQTKMKAKPVPVVVVQEPQPMKQQIIHAVQNLLITSTISLIPFIMRKVLANKSKESQNTQQQNSDLIQFS